MKDIILRPCIDEVGVPALNSLINHATNDICSKIFDDVLYLVQVLHLIDPTIDMTQYSNSNSSNGSSNGSSSSGSSSGSSTSSGSGNGNDSMNSTASSSGEHDNSTNTDNNSDKNREDGIRFLKELFFLARNLSLDRRSSLVSTMLKSLRVLFMTTIQKILADKRSSIVEKQCAADILANITLISPSAVRQTIIEGPIPSMPPHAEKVRPTTQTIITGQTNLLMTHSSHNDQCLLYVIIMCIINENDAATIEQLSDTIKILIDCDRLDRKDKEKFLGLCYDYYFHWLIVPFMEPNIPYEQIVNTDSNDDVTPQSDIIIAASRRFILDILCHCVHGHTYRLP